MNESRREVDEITYLATLVGQPSAIDAWLDPVREITSKVDASQAFSPDNLKTFKNVKSRLENYLINDEQIAAFTSESLQIRLKEHFESTKTLPFRLLGVLLVVVIVTIISIFIPASSPEIQGALVISAFNSMLSLGAAFFFLTSLNSFKNSVQKAFKYIGVGFIFASLSQIVVPIFLINFPPGSDGYQAVGTMIAVVDLISAGFLFVGVRAYAKLTDVHSKLLNLKYILLFILILSFVTIPILLAITQGHPIVKLDIVLQGWLVIMLTALALLISKISHTLTVAYSKAARALCQALILMSSVSAYFYVYYFLLLFFSEESLQLVFFPGMILGSITCLFNLRAGYSFYRSSKY